MGKRRNHVIDLSSGDDDDDDFTISRSFSSSNSKLNRRNTISISNSTSRRASSSKTTSSKKSRLSHSLSSSAQSLSNFDEFKFNSGNLADDFAGCKVSIDNRRFDGAESWVDKYRPHTLEDLAVHKKKVEEVRMWLEERLTIPKQGSQSYVLLITGQAGTGKSATVRVVASHLGAEICEWTTPTPTIWKEHVHCSDAGMRYISKLDEFENFVERARKYRMLSSSLTGLSKPLVLLIEDIPVANGKVAQRRLLSCLQLLVKSVLVPTVILVTDYSVADSVDGGVCLREKLSSSLESVGACKMAFNPITVNSIKKVLSKICRQEKCNTCSEQVNLIANASEGDIRHAITTFQYACLRQEKRGLVSSEKCTSDLEAKALYCGQKDAGSPLAYGRDQTLSLFHGLGKFLHNKRDADCTMSYNDDGFYLKEGFTRLPLKMDAPEKVLCQAHGQARPVAEFLHENVLDFLSQEAIEDAWTVVSYLCDADCLLSSFHRTLARDHEAENVVQSAAASVAVRGVLFGNAHPSTSRWHSIRRPELWQAEKSTRRNMHEMESQRLEYCFSVGLSNVSAICTDYRPALKWLGYRASLPLEHADVSNSLRQDNLLEIDELDQSDPHNQSCDISDDDIEEW